MFQTRAEPRRMPQPQETADDPARVHRWFRRALAGLTLLMLGLSWPLWVEGSRFPRVPFVPRLPAGGPALSWVMFLVLLATVAAGVRSRLALGSSALVLAYLIALDQHRFQPWAYQYGAAALALATCSQATGLGLCRLFIVALYAHSGLSKLDVSFCRELGLTFLSTAVRPFGTSPLAWPAAARVGAILAMPACELAVAAGLCFGRTRRLALAGAVALHFALLGILGPWGLGHSTIVLVWNAAMLVEVVILFRTQPVAPPQAEPRLAGLTRAAFLVAVFMPLTERLGLWDTWPSFALYASHAERTDVLVHESDLPRYPAEAQRAAEAVADRPGWRRINLTDWSRWVRGVPVYPQGRACNGLAEALAARYAGSHPMEVVQWSRAGMLTGQRERVELKGLAAIRRQGDRYLLNAHHAAWPAPARPPDLQTDTTLGTRAAY